MGIVGCSREKDGQNVHNVEVLFFVFVVLLDFLSGLLGKVVNDGGVFMCNDDDFMQAYGGWIWVCGGSERLVKGLWMELC